MMSFWGRYSRNITSTNFLPKDPVPPVTSTTCSDQFINLPRLGPEFPGRALRRWPCHVHNVRSNKQNQYSGDACEYCGCGEKCSQHEPAESRAQTGTPELRC